MQASLRGAWTHKSNRHLETEPLHRFTIRQRHFSSPSLIVHPSSASVSFRLRSIHQNNSSNQELTKVTWLKEQLCKTLPITSTNHDLLRKNSTRRCALIYNSIIMTSQLTLMPLHLQPRALLCNSTTSPGNERVSATRLITWLDHSECYLVTYHRERYSDN